MSFPGYKSPKTPVEADEEQPRQHLQARSTHGTMVLVLVLVLVLHAPLSSPLPAYLQERHSIPAFLASVTLRLLDS